MELQMRFQFRERGIAPLHAGKRSLSSTAFTDDRQPVSHVSRLEETSSKEQRRQAHEGDEWIKKGIWETFRDEDRCTAEKALSDVDTKLGRASDDLVDRKRLARVNSSCLATIARE
jgi:hypothetical protein